MAIYREHLGPVPRALAFIYTCFPLSLIYGSYALIFFLDPVYGYVLFGFGVTADLLRLRFARELKLPYQFWVELICDHKSDPAIERIYSRWYRRLTLPTVVLGFGYLILFVLADLTLPASDFQNYLSHFATLHEWVRENLFVAQNRSQNPITLAYPGRANYAAHLVGVTTLLLIIVPPMLFLGCNGCWTHLYIPARTTKSQKKRKIKSDIKTNKIDEKRHRLSIITLLPAAYFFLSSYIYSLGIEDEFTGRRSSSVLPYYYHSICIIQMVFFYLVFIEGLFSVRASTIARLVRRQQLGLSDTKVE